MISVAIADDHPIVVNGLQKVLATDDGIDIIGTCSNGDDLLTGLISK